MPSGRLRVYVGQACSVPNCPRIASVRGTCVMHYDRWRRNGSYETVRTINSPFRRWALRQIRNIEFRCSNPAAPNFRWYGGKGIKNYLTVEDFEFLWERDGAANMESPSIDRIDADGDYVFDNCRFIEHSENVRRGIERKKQHIVNINSEEER